VVAPPARLNPRADDDGFLEDYALPATISGGRRTSHAGAQGPQPSGAAGPASGEVVMTPYLSRDRAAARAAFPVPGAARIQPPTPPLPLGAGGPCERAAGWVLPAAAAATVQVLERDELLRLHAAAAVADLGLVVYDPGSRRAGQERVGAERASVTFVGLDDARYCPRLGGEGSRAVGRPGGSRAVGYVAGPSALAVAHALHGCCDAVLLLRAAGGHPRFSYPPPGPLARAGLSPREADVLVLVLAGQTDAEVAASLCVAPATARAHARAVLRKLGAADRRALRARLLGRDAAAGG
jgi:DNA-binding CsgD family transcriptional regulator